MVVAIGDIEAPICPHRDIGGHPEFGLGRRATVPAKAAIIVACATASHDRGDDAVRPDPTDAVAARIRDVEAAIQPKCQPGRSSKPGCCCWSAITKRRTGPTAALPGS